MPSPHPHFQVIKFVVSYEDGTSQEVQVMDNNDICFVIPEHTVYQMTIHFYIRDQPMKKLRYKQDVRKFSMTVRSREVEIGDEFVPQEEPYAVSFEKDKTPGGMMLRGDYDCESTYWAGDEVLFKIPWKLSVTK